MRKIVVAQVVAGLNPRSGGPSRTVTYLSNALARNGKIEVVLISQSATGEAAVPSAEGVIRRVRYSSSVYAIKSGLPVRSELASCFCSDPPSLIHSHGLWLPVNYWASSAARQYRIPLIIHPRGMLEPWAIKFRGWKKKLALRIFQERDLKTAKVLVATSLEEYENLRAFGIVQPIAVIPNGVELAESGLSSIQGGAACRVRKVLFLSRVHPKKGLFNLIEAWARLKTTNWQLCIAGPDEGGHLAEVMAMARQQKVQDSVEYIGEIEGPAKAAAYSGADIFVLPTFSENFGVVVAEALAHGIPVVTTRGAPWADLEEYECGWWIDVGVEPLVIALREAMSLTDEQRRSMGERGRAYVRRYDWDSIAGRMTEVYRWALESGPRPDCVQTD